MHRSEAGDTTAVSSMFTLGASSTALTGTTSASGVHQDSPHHLCRHGKELCAGLPFDLGHLYQPQIYLVDDCGGLERVAVPFILHVPAGHAAQFGIDVLRQLAERGLVSATPSLQ